MEMIGEAQIMGGWVGIKLVWDQGGGQNSSWAEVKGHC